LVRYDNQRTRRRKLQDKDPDKEYSTDEDSPGGGAAAAAAETDVEVTTKTTQVEVTNGRRNPDPGAASIVVDIVHTPEPPDPAEAGKELRSFWPLHENLKRFVPLGLHPSKKLSSFLSE
jgi:hypothetical protein